MAETRHKTPIGPRPLLRSLRFLPGGPRRQIRPIWLCNESWISHTGAWLAATSGLLRARLSVRNTLLLTRNNDQLRLLWDDASEAVDYRVYSSPVDAGPYDTVIGSPAESQITIIDPGDDLIFFRVTGADRYREGPP